MDLNFEKFQLYLKEEEEWNKKHWFFSFFKEGFYFLWYRIPNEVRNLHLRAKWASQRVFRGFDDRAYWGLNSYLAKTTIPVLKWMQEKSAGIHIIDGYEDKTFEEQSIAWNEVLGKMILAFQIMVDEDIDYEIHNPEYYKETEKKVQEGLQLFCKYYRGLWD
jgi:hypothetical protein